MAPSAFLKLFCVPPDILPLKLQNSTQGPHQQNQGHHINLNFPHTKSHPPKLAKLFKTNYI